MKHWQILTGIFFLLTACMKEGMEEAPGDGQENNDLRKVVVKREGGHEVDSAQVFFFRRQAQRDTLLLREVIHGIEQYKPLPFYFQLPAGKYKVYIWGNVPTERIVARPPYSPDSIWLDYTRGKQPSAVYFGKQYLDIGVDTLKMTGMILLSSSVELAIREVPSGVEKIIVRLSNTLSGIRLTGSYLPKVTDPPLSDTLENLRQDSTYKVHFYCLPPPYGDKNTLEVLCYGATGNILYSGQSAPFEARPGENSLMACEFRRQTLQKVKTRKALSVNQGLIYFEGKEK